MKLDNEKYLRKIRLVRSLVVYLLLPFVIGRILYLQYGTDYAKVDEKNSITKRELKGTRGDIITFEGNVLATSQLSYKLCIDCTLAEDSVFNSEVGALADSLSWLFKDKTSKEYLRILSNGRRSEDRYIRLGNRNITPLEKLRVENFPIFKHEHKKRFSSGIICETVYKRILPYGRLAFRTIGFTNNQGGVTGIEGSYESLLKGKDGYQMERISGRGEQRIPINDFPEVAPEAGFDVISTLDVSLQEATENALRSKLVEDVAIEGGTAVVMDVATGAIRAIANMRKGKNGKFDESYNYAIAERQNPGSTFKLATLITLLEDNKAKLSDLIETGQTGWVYGGHTFKESSGHGYGTLTLQRCFEKSSNVGFAKTVVERYKDSADIRRFINHLYDLKMARPLEVELLGGASSTIASPGTLLWSKLSLPMISIGYEVEMTPIHTLTLYNAIANNGKMVRPHFIEYLTKDGKILEQDNKRPLSNSICSKHTIKEVKKALRGVVTDGTAKVYFEDAPYSVSGKTGTAQIAFNDGKSGKRVFKDSYGNRKYQASFVGFVPSEEPKYSIIVVVYSNKSQKAFYGGTWAAPVFRKISDYLYSTEIFWSKPLEQPNNKDMISTFMAQADAEMKRAMPNSNAGAVPSVVGLPLKEAVNKLEQCGLKVQFSGKGKVTSQTPVAGTLLSELSAKKASINLSQTKVREHGN